MVVTLIFEALCIAAVLFMIRVLVALARERSRPKSCSQAVHLSSGRVQRKNYATAIVAGAAEFKRDAIRHRLEVIAGEKMVNRKIG